LVRRLASRAARAGPGRSTLWRWRVPGRRCGRERRHAVAREYRPRVVSWAQ